MIRTSRRTLLKASAAAAGAAAFGFPSITYAQAEKIKIGHLTPLTGFLGALGAYAQLGIRMAEEEINAAGGVMGRPLDILSEDSVNPATASTKAQRMLDQDGVTVLMGEINSASALTIMQVADRNKKLFMQIGARSDALRGKNCNRFTFHVDIPSTVMVNAVGKALVRDNMMKDKKFYTLTADYIFGHDLARAAKVFFDGNGGKLIGDELVATDVTDFSPYLLKIRQAKPDVVCSNLAGNQVTNLIKQYAEFGLPFPIVGFNLNTADAWAAGDGNLSGTWPTVWYHTSDVPASKTFVANFTKKYGKPPENHAWIEYVALKMMAQAMNETKSTDTDTLIGYFEKQTEFDILKARKAYFRSWDHQLMQEAYPFTVKAKGQAKDKWDTLELGAAIPAASESLESIALTKTAPMLVLLGYLIVHIFEHTFASHLHFGEETHHDEVHNPVVGISALVGMLVHTFFDGVAIGAGFEVSQSVGLLIFLAVLLHKIPDGFTISSIVITSGHSAKSALAAATSLGVSTLVGVLAVHLLGGITYALPIATGSTLYVAATDLMPEVNREKGVKMAFVVFAGMGLFLLVRTIAM
jgi:branched-chain amino acid transport system substrate-binding protein